MGEHAYDAVVVGSGPNGLAAAIEMASAGCSVAVFEAKETAGGGMRTAQLTLPGFLHDICSAIHPLGVGSPFFQKLSLEKYGLQWVHPTAPLAHPFDDGTAAMLERSIEATGEMLGPDKEAYRHLMQPLTERWGKIAEAILGPPRFPSHPIAVARFVVKALQSAESLAKRTFSNDPARGLFAGLAGHSVLPLDACITSAFALVLGILGHAYGWPFPKGGSQKIADALTQALMARGGKIFTGAEVKNIDELPKAQAIFLDVTPRQTLHLAGHHLPDSYKKKLEKYRYGPGVFKVDWALSAPIPWKAEMCKRAGTVHLGGTLEEIAASERQVWQGRHPEKPYVLLAQQSLFDNSRAPPGKHTAWAYCHVPNGSVIDMTDRIETQVERFAPGFKECILARHTFSPAAMESYNANYIGGDIAGGVQDFWQVAARPVASLNPYRTPLKGLYLCSSSTPPGGGVHGMCGYHAARAALRRL